MNTPPTSETHQNRWVKLIRNIAVSAGARVVNLAITLLLVPLTVNSLSSTDYVALAVILSLSALSSYADFGLGHSVVNSISASRNKSNDLNACSAVSSVWFILLSVSWIGSIASCFVYVHLYRQMASEAETALAIATFIVFFGMPTGLSQRILFARQRTIESNIWSIAPRVLSIIAIAAAERYGETNLTLVVLIVLGFPALFGWIQTAALFWRSDFAYLRPRRAKFSLHGLQTHSKIGFAFVIMQCVQYAESSADVVILSRFESALHVQAFDIYQKLFNYVPALISIAIYPLWPAIAEAISQGDRNWVKSAIRRAMLFASVGALTTVVLAGLLSENLVLAWTSKELQVDKGTLCGLIIFSLLSSIGYVQSMIANGLGIISQQAKLYAVYCIFMIILKWLGANWAGASGLLLFGNLCLLIRISYAEILIRKWAPNNKSSATAP